MSPRYSNVTSSIRGYDYTICITQSPIRLFNQHKELQRAPQEEKQRQERASTPMHRLPQCHLGNPRVECQNIYQVNQYDTTLSLWVFIARHTSSVLNIQSDKTKSHIENSIHNKIERGKHHMIQLY